MVVVSDWCPTELQSGQMPNMTEKINAQDHHVEKQYNKNPRTKFEASAEQLTILPPCQNLRVEKQRPRSLTAFTQYMRTEQQTFKHDLGDQRAANCAGTYAGSVYVGNKAGYSS